MQRDSFIHRLTAWSPQVPNRIVNLGGAQFQIPTAGCLNFNSRVAKYLTRWEMGNGK
jgi:hypothetical protein